MSKIETKQITLVSENGLVEKTLSIDNSGVVRIDGIEQAGIVSGDWTPIIMGETVNGVGTYLAQEGSYTKIGKLVYIFAHIKISGHTGSGSTLISNLPFPVVSSGTPFSVITDMLDFEDNFKYLTTYSTRIHLYLAGVRDSGAWGDCSTTNRYSF